jgi:hypothetical protein
MRPCFVIKKKEEEKEKELVETVVHSFIFLLYLLFL